MADSQQPPSSTPLAVNQTRVEDANTPIVSSPLNPDAAASRVRTREQREKKAVSQAVDACLSGPS